MQRWILGSVLCLTVGAGNVFAETAGVAVSEKSSTATQSRHVAIAVTDLTYTDSVSEYFQYTELHQKADSRSSNQNQASGPSLSGSASGESHSSTDYVSSAGTYTHIDSGELRNMTADIRGEIIKTRAFRMVQARPYLRPEKDKEEKAVDLERAKKLMHPGASVANTQKSAPEKIYDIIDRIKQGYYPGADYVLFGTVSSVEFRNEMQPIQGTASGGNSGGTFSRFLNLDLVAEFSLIDTRSYEVKAAFSAAGEGQDIRLIASRVPGAVHMNRGKVIRETSQSLAQDVIKQLTEQFGVGGTPGKTSSETRTEKNEKVINFR